MDDTSSHNAFHFDPGCEPENITIGQLQIPLLHFLKFCASGDPAPLGALPDGADPTFLRARFLKAGAAELEGIAENAGWVQLSLTPTDDLNTPLYRSIAALLEAALESGDAVDGFFMHKTPGLRLRLRAATTDPRPCQTRLSDSAEEWVAADLASRCGFEAYEPETGLFGGPESMAHVHQLFTADSRFWLTHHARQQDAISTLAVSLLLLRQFFAACGIVDWEDVDVWDKVRTKTGRALISSAELPSDTARDVASAIVEFWTDQRSALSALGPTTQAGAETLARAYHDLCPRWQACLRRLQVTVAPRAAVALYVIFFLNRAGLSLERQTLVAEALARRPILD